MKFEVCGFEHLHRHTDFSLLDGLATVEEYAEYSKQVDQDYLCVTDHGMMGVIPRQIRACDKHKLSPLFGIEAYINDNQPAINDIDKYKEYVSKLSDEDRQKLRKSYHILAIAYNNVGYSNLVNLSSWAHEFGYGGVPRQPRLTHKKLKEHKEGILFTSGCYLGEIGQAFDRQGPVAAEEMLKKYMEMFKSDFYLEIMLLDFKKQKAYDAWLVEMYDKYHLPIIVSQDCHYCKKGDSRYQQYMLMTRTKNTVHDIEKAKLQGDAEERFFELQDTNLWMKSEAELNEKWLKDYRDVVPYEVFCEAKRTTVEICRRAEGVQIDRSIKLPKLEEANQKLKEAIARGMKWRGVLGKPKYIKQLKKEYELICRKDFATYFLITKKVTDEARRICPKILGWGTGAEALGPGRGSSVGFLTCYVLGITDVDPIKHDLLPERFLSDARGGRQLKLEFETDPISE